MRLGVFGGTFDPVHIGHLLLADVALGDAGLDRILFVPAAAPPHKPGGAVSPAGVRLEMLQAAIAGHPGFEASGLELERTGPSYTADTLAGLAADPRWAGSELFLIVGTDMLLDLPRWSRPEAILGMARLLAAERPGYDGRAAQPAVLARTVFLRTPRIDVSSSEIRRRAAEGRSVRYWVADSVERIIRERGVYRA
jgi:nicotinate-nucleotide adenylyltransferase